jgi:hypothetical protein
MELPSQLTEKQSAAIVDCLILFARHGRQLRLQREQAEREKKKTKIALTLDRRSAILKAG